MLVRFGKPTRDPAVLKRSIIRAVISKLPTEELFEKFLGSGDICRLKLDIIDFVNRVRCHRSISPPNPRIGNSKSQRNPRLLFLSAFSFQLSGPVTGDSS